MATAESSSVTVSRRRLSARRRTVVWLRGEHDISTVDALSETLAGAMALDDCDLVVDLSEVEFMGAATIGVLVRARELLESRSRSLVLRSPSRCARRIVHLCGQGDLLEPRRADATPATGTTSALGTWVTVPTADRVDQLRRRRRTTAAPQIGSLSAASPPQRWRPSVDANHRADERTTDRPARGDRE
jgi:anti-anti-sigma factor